LLTGKTKKKRLTLFNFRSGNQGDWSYLDHTIPIERRYSP
jgi:hypothetical protein